MPVLKCPNGKWRIGSGKCIYATKEKADSAYVAYLAIKHSKKENIMKLTKCHSVCLKDSAGFDPKEYKIAKGGLMTNGKRIPSSIVAIWGKGKELEERLPGSAVIGRSAPIGEDDRRHVAQALYFPMGKFTVSSMKAFLEKNEISYVSFKTGAKNKLAEMVAGAKHLSTYPKEIPFLLSAEAFFSLQKALEKAVSLRFGQDAWASDFSSMEVIVGYSKSDNHPISSWESGEYEKIGYKIIKGEIKLVGAITTVTKAVSYVAERTDEEWDRLWKIEAAFVERLERVARICRAFKS